MKYVPLIAMDMTFGRAPRGARGLKFGDLTADLARTVEVAPREGRVD